MRLSVYKSFEPALLGRVLRFWNERVPLFSRIEVQGPGMLSWGLAAEVAKDELRVLVLDPEGLSQIARDGAPLLRPEVAGRAPLVVLLPDASGSADPGCLRGTRVGPDQLLDGEALSRAAGLTQLLDPESLRLAGVPYVDALYLVVGTALFRRAFAELWPEPKVLALDCDGTLWQGLCAEDGPAGVTIGPEERALHQFLLEQKRAGRLLTLVSKNVPADVEAVFRSRSDLGLTLTDIAATRVGWSRKSEALQQLARELNLGLDSFVFLDDSPAECAEIRAALPEVAVLQRPAQGARALCESAWLLDLRKKGSSALGEERTRLYREEAERRAAERAAPSFEEHLQELQVRTEVRVPRGTDEARLFELCQRTNQFHTAADRPSAADVRARMAAGTALAVRVSDRFGDYGICGAVFFSEGLVAGQPVTGLRVDRFLLSCRVLGRGVEEDVIDALADRARERQLEALQFDFTPTQRNLPVQRFLRAVAGRLGVPAPEGATSFVFPLALLDRCPRLLLRDGEGGDDGAPARQRPRAAAAPEWTEVARLTQDLAALATALGLSAGLQRDQLQGGDEGVLQVIAEVLGRPVTAGDNLYALGADSLRLVRLLSRLKSRLGLELPIGEVLHRADVQDLLGLAERARASVPSAHDEAAFLAQIQSLYDDDEELAR